MIDTAKIRRDFPILEQSVYGRPLVYLDNAATTHKPGQVLRILEKFYSEENSNIHRGVHFLSGRAGEEYARSREKVREFLQAEQAEEIIFIRGTTESINLVADTFGRRFIRPGDEIIISEMEHHSNIVPWQMLCQRSRAFLKVLPFTSDAQVSLQQLEDMITPKTRLIALTYVSNVLGVINPVQEIISRAHARDVPVLIDAAQAVQHLAIDVQQMDCDFLAFSGHKIYAGNGIGVLYGKKKWLDQLPPYQFGGGMIRSVCFEKTEFEAAPLKFEAGTPNISGAIGLAAALSYIEDLGFDQIASHEDKLMRKMTSILEGIDGVEIYAPNAHRCGAVAFNVYGANDYDIGMLLDKMGIAVRTGTHCAEPIMKHYGVKGMARASLALYNTEEEIMALGDGLKKAGQMLKV
ncbi:MAG: aminotransferase class V-fold PLP-dependent enzyme [Candidatus Omnitrophota bacterium]